MLQVLFPAHSMFSFTKQGAEPMRKSIAHIRSPSALNVWRWTHMDTAGCCGETCRQEERFQPQPNVSALLHKQKAIVRLLVSFIPQDCYNCGWRIYYFQEKIMCERTSVCLIAAVSKWVCVQVCSLRSKVSWKRWKKCVSKKPICTCTVLSMIVHA